MITAMPRIQENEKKYFQDNSIRVIIIVLQHDTLSCTLEFKQDKVY